MINLSGKLLCDICGREIDTKLGGCKCMIDAQWLDLCDECCSILWNAYPCRDEFYDNDDDDDDWSDDDE